MWAALPVAAGFALFGAIVWLAYEDTSPGPALGEPPLIKAVADPIKLPPEQAEEEATAVDGGAIGRLWSDTERAEAPERLLPLPEEPLSPEVVAAPDASATAPPSAPAEPEPPSSSAAPAATEVATAPPAATAPAPAREEESQAAEAALDRLLAEVAALSEPQPASPGATTAPTAPEAPAVSPATPPTSAATAASTSPAPAEPVRTADVARAEAPPVPPTPSAEIRPAAAVSAPSAPAAPAAATGTAAPAPAPATQVAALEDRFRIQLAAVREEADARRAWDGFQADLGPVLAEVRPFFERAETANGIFYRVQVGPFATQQAADSLCEQLKRHNASCFVIRR